ncbi:Phosphoethanolamine N-methyltransferase 1 [Cytospora mali]|uniref:Phosphoethanolamine N-methyltransferase 1 n=1 Tax=Cytospora mali TaxID=578113 RepID=A0A194VJ21_CYTMA|nr:Phosphoethanolamine N-methyltransferase 1 [Valsa mali]
MDPLHKTDSAISVTSKDNDTQEELYTSHQPPPAKRFKSATDDSSRPVTPGTRQASLPVTQASASTMENLIPPLDHNVRPGTHGSPSPIFFDRAISPLISSQPQPPASPDHRASPWPSTEAQLAYPCSPESQPPSAADAHGEQQDNLDAVFQATHGSITVDHGELEPDQGYESDRASFASTSLSSSARDYLYENGRRYHRFREGRYNFPNDEAEQDREDMKHACVKMLCQKLHFAPIDEGTVQNILDIGTGTGIWAIEMGDRYPSANVLGIDLSPIQPDWVPSNVHFVVDDAESEWLYPENHFDYVHSRHTVMAIKDWPKLYRQAWTHLKPGAWIESQEIYHYPISANGTMPPDHPIAQYWGLIKEGLGNLGIDFHAAAGGKIGTMMREAGFENIHEHIFHVPLGTWAKHPNLKIVGEYWRQILLEGAQAIALGPLTRGCGWTREQVEVFLVEVRKAYFDNSCLMYMPMYIVYGQKPEHGY